MKTPPLFAVALLVLSPAAALLGGCDEDPSDEMRDPDASAHGGDTAPQPPDLGPGDAQGRKDVSVNQPDAAADASIADGNSSDSSVDIIGSVDGASADVATSANPSVDGGIDGGCTGWNSLVRLSPADLADLMAKSDPIVIDVHTPYYGDIPGTDTSIPYTNVNAIEAYVHKDHCADIVLVCESGYMSQLAGNELIKRGYLRVRDLAGGMLAWEKLYPLLKDGGT